LGKGGGAAGISAAYSVEEHVAKAKGELRDIADELFEYVSGLGDDVVASPVKLYVAFRTTRNFCCLEPHAKHLSSTFRSTRRSAQAATSAATCGR